jgi:hypothetical protein
LHQLLLGLEFLFGVEVKDGGFRLAEVLGEVWKVNLGVEVGVLLGLQNKEGLVLVELGFRVEDIL